MQCLWVSLETSYIDTTRKKPTTFFSAFLCEACCWIAIRHESGKSDREREREKTTPAKANNYSYTFCLDVKSSCPISLPFNNPYSNRSNNNKCTKKFSCTLWIIATHFHLHIISKTARRQYQISENVCSRDFYFIKRWERYVQILRNETGAKRKQNYEKRIF